jgi:hypothetical protein
MKYRVEYSRWDCQIQASDFDAENDQAAKEHFEKGYCERSWYDWDDLRLIRVDVVEKTTNLGYRHSKEEGPKYYDEDKNLCS